MLDGSHGDNITVRAVATVDDAVVGRSDATFFIKPFRWEQAKKQMEVASKDTNAAAGKAVSVSQLLDVTEGKLVAMETKYR